MLQIVDEMKMDDDHKKPGLNDLLIVRLFMFPYWLYTFILSLSTKVQLLRSTFKYCFEHFLT